MLNVGTLTGKIELQDLYSKVLLGVVGGVAAAVTGIAALGARGAEVNDVATAFDTLSDSVGLSADTLIGKLQGAMGGTVSKFDLMKTSNEAMSQGLKLTEAQFTLTANTARVLADRTGGDAAEAFATLTNAMATGRDRGLMSIKMNIDAAAAVEKYASAHHILSADMTEAQQIEAKRDAMLLESQRILTQSGIVVNDFGDKIQAGWVKIKDFTDALGVQIAQSPVLAAGMDAVGASLSAAFGPSQEILITRVMSIINQGGIYLVDFGIIAAQSADLVGRTFGGLQVVFGGVMTAIFFMVESTMKGVTSMLDLVAMMPNAALDAATGMYGLGAATDQAAAAGKREVDQLTAMRKSFQDQTKEAWESVKGHNAISQGSQVVVTGLTSIKGAMVAAQSAMAAEALEAKNFVGPMAAVTDSHKKGAAAADTHTLSAKAQATQAKAAAEAAKIATAAYIEWRDAMRDDTAEADRMNIAIGKSINLWDQFTQMGHLPQGFIGGPEVSGAAVMGINNITDAFGPMIAAENQATVDAGLLDGAYMSLGMKTPAQLQVIATEAVRAFDIVKASGTATPQAITAAHDTMVAAVIASTGKIPSIWTTEIGPKVTSTVSTIQAAVTGSFAQMLLNTKSFAQGWSDIWNSLKAGVLNIFNSILSSFINTLLKGMIGALSGQQGAMSSAFGSMLGGVGVGGSGGAGGGSVIQGLVSKGVQSGIGALIGGAGGAALIGGVGAGAVGIGAGIGGGVAAMSGVGGIMAAGTGVGSAAAGGGILAGGLATGAATMGIGLAVAGAVLLGMKLFGKKEEKATNNARDAFFAQFGTAGTGAGSGFGTVAAKLTEATGEAGGGTAFQSLIKAEDQKAFETASANVLAILEKQKLKQDEITAATAETAAVADASIIAIEAETVARAAQLDQVKNKILADIDAIHTEQKSLIDSIANEAPEAVAGVVEQQAIAQIAALDAEATALNAKLASVNADTAAGFTTTVESVTAVTDETATLAMEGSTSIAAYSDVIRVIAIPSLEEMRSRGIIPVQLASTGIGDAMISAAGISVAALGEIEAAAWKTKAALDATAVGESPGGAREIGVQLKKVERISDEVSRKIIRDAQDEKREFDRVADAAWRREHVNDDVRTRRGGDDDKPKVHNEYHVTAVYDGKAPIDDPYKSDEYVLWMANRMFDLVGRGGGVQDKGRKALRVDREAA